MGRPARPLGVRLGSAAVLVVALLVVAAPLAAAKPAPPPASTATTKAAPPEPAESKPAEQKPAPAPTATTAPPADPGFTTAKTGDPSIVVPLPGGPFFPGGPIAPPPPPPPDPQPNPRITVTPHTDLQDGQTVQVDAKGYTPNTSVGTAQCRAGATDINDCDLSHSLITTSGDDGTWSASLVVGARIRVGDEVVDCREEECVVGAARTSDYKEVAGVTLAFDPDLVLPPPPSLSVSPDADLVHDQQVTVTGTGFTPGDRVYTQQCADREPYPVCDFSFGPGEIVADGAGSASTAFVVKRLIGYPGEVLIDCADARCYVQMSSQSDPFATSRADLDFDPDGALPPRPTGTASPDRDLVHGQAVDVTGSGFAPFEALRITQCSIADDPYPACAYPGIGIPAVGPVDGDGNLSTSFNVRRLLGSPAPGGTVVDCAEKPGCVIRVSSYENLLHSVDIPIAFDPDAPLPPPPSLRIDPDSGLNHNDVVTVSGSGFVSGDFVELYECLEDDGLPGGFCAYSGYGGRAIFADANGDFTTPFTVKRVFGNPGTPLLDCVDADECALYARSISDPFASTEHELRFDPDAPLPPPPSLTVEPSTNLGWQTDAHVSGSGFAPNTSHNVVQCTKGSEFFSFQCRFGPGVNTDEQGNLTADITLRRHIDGYPEPFDCAPDKCVVAVYSYDDPISLGSVELTFDPDAPRPPRPTLTVTPPDFLADGSTVHVDGAGFPPNAVVGLAQCSGEDTLVPDCDGSLLRILGSDGEGRISADFTVKPGIFASSGIIGCYDAPGACSLRAAVPGDPDATTVPALLTFGGPAPRPPGVGGGDSGGGTTPTPVRNQSATRLAATGTPVRGYLEFAAIFLGLGTLLVLASRRRRLQL